MKVGVKETKRGVQIVMGEKVSDIFYPETVWKEFPKNLKEVFMDNIAYSKTMIVTLVDGLKSIEYQTSTPLLKSFFDACCIKDIPRMPFDKNGFIGTSELFKKFINSEYKFTKNGINYPYYDTEVEDGAVVAFSFGKDSLLSYALLEEAGFGQQPVYVKDIFDYEAEVKMVLKKRFENEFKKKIEVVEDYSDRLLVDKHECFNPLLTNAINNYSLMLLPFSYYTNYKYIVFGNERNLSNFFINEDNMKVYASYDQTTEWVRQQKAFMSILTSNKVDIFSPIEPLHTLAIMKLLNKRYPQYAKYQQTCMLEDYEEKERWCCKCSSCSEIYAILKALNIDTKERGFKKDMFSKEYREFYPLFNGKNILVQDRPKESRDEQLLTFYMAYKNKAKGDLIEEFKEKFLEEAKTREDELYKRYLGVGNSENTPYEIRKKIMPILKEELKQFF